MPELPEVENFRQLLLPLVSSSSSSSPVNNNNNKKKKNNDTDDDDFLHLERLNLDKKPPRKFLSDEDIETINQHQYYVQDVLRRGKLICMVLESSSSGSSSGSKEEEEDETTTTTKTKYLYIHMGMTGRISTSDYVPNLVELKKDSEYPPPHTYLKFSTTKHEACFSDPRKFGSILLQSNKDEFDQLAPDALMEIIIMEDDNETDNNNDKKKEEEEEEDDVKKKKKKQTTTIPVVTVVKPEIITKLTNQSMGIKPLLLDQKRVISGVGNWVADEVLYQTSIHPDQNYLSQEESQTLLLKLYHILQIAVNCLLSKKQFPKEWLFNYRWNSKQTTKDVHGRTVTFITSGGRTSAIVPSIQKKKGRKKLAAAAAATKTTTTKETNTTAANKNTKKKKRRQKEEEEPVALNDDDSSDDEDTNKKPKAKKIKKTTTAAAAVGSSSSNDKKIIKKKDTSESSSRNPPTTKKKKTNNKKGGKKQKASPPDLAQTAGGGNRRRSPRFSDAS